MCLFKHKEMTLVVLYVDDLLISAEDDTIIYELKLDLLFACACLRGCVAGVDWLSHPAPHLAVIISVLRP